MKITKATPSGQPTINLSYNTRNSNKYFEEHKDRAPSTQSKESSQGKTTISQKLKHERKSNVNAATISSACQQKQAIKSDIATQNQIKEQKLLPKSILNKSKAETKKQAKRNSKKSSEDDNVDIYGVDSPSQQDIQTNKRHAQDFSAIDNVTVYTVPTNTASAFDQRTGNIIGSDAKENDTEEKPKAKKKSRTKSNTSASKIDTDTNQQQQKKEEEEDEHCAGEMKQEQEQQKPVSMPKVETERLSKSEESKGEAEPKYSEPIRQPTLKQNPLLRQRDDSGQERLPGDTKAKKVKGGRIIPSSRHVLIPIKENLSIDDLKDLALHMLKSPAFITDCEWVFTSSTQMSVWVCHRKLTHELVKLFGLKREDMPARERRCSWTDFEHNIVTKASYGFEQIYIKQTVKDKRDSKDTIPFVKQGQADRTGDPSLLSGVASQDNTTAMSSDLGEHIPQKMISIPLSMPFRKPSVSNEDLYQHHSSGGVGISDHKKRLNDTILTFLKQLIHDNWTVAQLKGKFFKSGHQPIFEAILKNEADLKLYEQGVTDTSAYLTEEELQAVTKQKIDRDDLIRKMVKQPPTTRIDDVLAEAGFGHTQSHHGTIAGSVGAGNGDLEF